jgi:hypothetical protein
LGRYGILQEGFGNGAGHPRITRLDGTLRGFYSLAANLLIVFAGSALSRLFVSQE